MEGRDSERDPSVDDWFDEPEALPPRRRRGGRRMAESETAEDPWVIPGDAPPRRRPRAESRAYTIGGRTLSSTQVGILAVIALVVLLALLAAAGVFSGSSTPTAAPVTVTRIVTVTTSAPKTTTPSATQTPTLTVPTTTVHPNDTGTPVKQLQAALIQLGYLKGKADGIFGPGTKAALVAFQQASNLTADGIAGAKTLAALKQALAGKTG